MTYLAIVSTASVCLGIVVGWITSRKSNDLATVQTDIETDRRNEEVEQKNALPSANLDIYPTLDGYLRVINNGAGLSTEASIMFAAESEVRPSGSGDTHVMSLIDLKPGGRTTHSIGPAPGDARIKVTLHWKDPTGHNSKEVDDRLRDLLV